MEEGVQLDVREGEPPGDLPRQRGLAGAGRPDDGHAPRDYAAPLLVQAGRLIFHCPSAAIA